MGFAASVNYCGVLAPPGTPYRTALLLEQERFVMLAMVLWLQIVVGGAWPDDRAGYMVDPTNVRRALGDQRE
jgi:hypothetical protein